MIQQSSEAIVKALDGKVDRTSDRTAVHTTSELSTLVDMTISVHLMIRRTQVD